MAMPTREELAQALVVQRLRIICLSKALNPSAFEVRLVQGKLALLDNGKVVVIGDPVTRQCHLV